MEKVLRAIRFQFTTFLKPFLVFTVAQNQISKFSNSIKSFRTRGYQFFFRFVLFNASVYGGGVTCRLASEERARGICWTAAEKCRKRDIGVNKENLTWTLTRWGRGSFIYTCIFFCWSVAHVTGHQVKSEPSFRFLYFLVIFKIYLFSFQRKGIKIKKSTSLWSLLVIQAIWPPPLLRELHRILRVKVKLPHSVNWDCWKERISNRFVKLQRDSFKNNKGVAARGHKVWEERCYGL